MRGLALVQRTESSQLIELATTVRHARAGEKAQVIAAGQALLQAKAMLNHGEWLEFLRVHCDISPRRAQRYMRAADPSKTTPCRLSKPDEVYAHQLDVLSQKFGTSRRVDTVKAAVDFAYDAILKQRCAR